jgi:hypothetical protein
VGFAAFQGGEGHAIFGRINVGSTDGEDFGDSGAGTPEDANKEGGVGGDLVAADVGDHWETSRKRKTLAPFSYERLPPNLSAMVPAPGGTKALRIIASRWSDLSMECLSTRTVKDGAPSGAAVTT